MVDAVIEGIRERIAAAIQVNQSVGIQVPENRHGDLQEAIFDSMCRNTIAHFDGGPFSKAHFHLFAVGRVACPSHIDGDPQVWVDGISGGRGATDAHFLLDAEDKIQLVRGIGDVLQGLDKHSGSDPVIHRFRNQPGAHIEERLLHHCHIGYPDRAGLPVGCPQVEVHLLDGLQGAGILPALHVDHSDGAIQKAHPSSRQIFRVNAAQAGEASKTIFFDVRHNDPNLIHVSSQHDFQTSGIFYAFASNQVAQGVNPHLVGVGFDLVAKYQMPTPKQGYFNEKGERVPGTTTVISRFKEAGGLIHWAWDLGKQGIDYRKVKEHAATSGTLAHDAVEAYIHKTPFEWTGEPEIVEKAQKSFGAFKEWAEQSNLVITHTEIQLVSNVHNFGGTLDAMFLSGKRSMGDWKTSGAIYQDYLMQLGAYGILWEENFPDDPITGGYHLIRFDKEHGDFNHKWWGELEDAKEMFLLY